MRQWSAANLFRRALFGLAQRAYGLVIVPGVDVGLGQVQQIVSVAFRWGVCR